MGKTLSMVHFLTEELIRTERYVVTNIPMQLPELAEYLDRVCQKRKVRVPDIARRLLCITTAEALNFWRYRSGQFVLPEWDGKDEKGKLLPEEDLLSESEKYWTQIGEKSGSGLPVTYFISEAHRYFNAKRFQRVSVVAELYVTHHRHLHDEVFFDTQYPSQLAVALRELTEEWHVLRNDYNRRIGFVKMLPRIRMSSYYEVPSGGNKPFEKRNVFIAEDGPANCYKSTGALGSVDRAMEQETRKNPKGIPLRVFVGLIALGLAGFACLLWMAPKVMADKMAEQILPDTTEAVGEKVSMLIRKEDTPEIPQVSPLKVRPRIIPAPISWLTYGPEPFAMIGNQKMFEGDFTPIGKCVKVTPDMVAIETMEGGTRVYVQNPYADVPLEFVYISLKEEKADQSTYANLN